MHNFSPYTILLISSCLLASGCTEKTTINEAAAIASPIIDTTPTPDSTTANSISADSENQIDTAQVTTNPVANMIDPTTTTTQDPITTITTPPIDFPEAVLNPIPGAPNSNTPSLPTTDDNPAVSDPVTSVVGNPLVPVVADDLTPAPTDTTPAVIEPVIPETTTGVAGMTVNCEQSLPCRWISADTAFSVTVTNVDNNGRLNRLRVDYAIVAAHDSEMSITGANPAIDADGATLTTASVSLGNGVGGVAQGLLAGSELPGSVEFNSASTSSALNTWSIALSDSGLTRTPTFTNLPVGPLTTQIADCENTLPCVWIPPNAEVTITLIAVSGTGSSNLLTTNFSVETTRTATVAIDSGAVAVGVDGTSYRGRTHSVGQQTSSEKLTVDTISGAKIVATVLFFRTQSVSSALQHLSLVTYEDNPVPRWNPTFTNVPVL